MAKMQTGGMPPSSQDKMQKHKMAFKGNSQFPRWHQGILRVELYVFFHSYFRSLNGVLIELAIYLHINDKRYSLSSRAILETKDIINGRNIQITFFNNFFSREPSVLLSREWTVKSEHLLPELKLVNWLIMQVVRNIFVGTITLNYGFVILLNH